MYNTLEQSLKTNKAVIVSASEYVYQGLNRQILKVRKLNGKRLYSFVRYESGQYSSAV